MLITHDTFNVSNVSFLNPKEIDLSGGGGAKKSGMKSYRIPIRYTLPGSSDGQALKIQMPKLFSWGVQEYLDGDTVSSYSMSLVMYNAKLGPTTEEQATIDMFEEILNVIRKYLKSKSTQSALKKYNMDSDVDKMDVFFRKRVEGVIVDGVAPVMYPKLYTRRNDKKLEIESKFYDTNDEKKSAEEFIGKRMTVVTSVVVDNIFIGARPSIQLRVKECIVMNSVFEERELFLPKTVCAVNEKSVFDDDDDDLDELIKRKNMDDDNDDEQPRVKFAKKSNKL